MELPVNSLTAAIWLPRIEIPNGVEFAGEFIRRTGGTLDHEPIVLPFNQPLPPEAPRIVLRSKDGVHVCEFAQTRVNFHYHNRTRSADPIETVFPRFREALYKAITTLSEMVEGKPPRLGFVAKLVKQTPTDGSTALLDEFIDGDRFDGAAETHLHFLHTIDMEGTPCNRWIKFHTVRPRSAPTPSNVVVFEIDINSRAEVQRLFEPPETIGFYLEAYEETRRQAARLLAFAGDE